MTLATESLVVSYPSRSSRALDSVSLDVGDGTTLAVVGPSGAGKTTLLRAIAGLIDAASGDIRLDGTSIRALPARHRRVAMVFQDDALFANMSVRENLRFALRGGASATGDVAMAAAAVALHVVEHLDRPPRRLSGGERQRVSIARALLSDPRALLLDEPLAHLDPSLRRSVRDEVIGVRQHFAGPILYVTHDHVEAMSVGDALAVLIDGKVVDAGPPQRVYDAPRTIAVARFLGERPMNLFEDGNLILGIRPERIRLSAEAALRGRVVGREPTGADAYLDVQTPRGSFAVRVPATESTVVGDLVGLDLPPEGVRRFDPQGGAAVA
ncbi:MAG: ABC transporter ATP-binding protein [Candidatus Baltobacteraceae bacterium]